MSLTIRVLLVIVSLLTLWYVQRKIKKSQLQLEDSIYWILVSVCLVTISIFPQLAFVLSQMLGFQSPINLVFLIIIFILLIKVFTLSIKVSQLESKLVTLVEELAIKEKDHYEK